MNARLRAVLFTAAATAAFVAPVSLVHQLTKDRVERNEELRAKRAVLAAAGVEPPADAVKLASLFAARAKEKKAADGYTFYRVASGDDPDEAGYVIQGRGAGLWGRIVALVGFGPDRKTLTGLAFLEQSETPGLGARIEEPWFTSQFRGKSGPFATVPEGEPAGAGQFDAVSGATFTSNAVRDILNDAVARVPALGD